MVRLGDRGRLVAAAVSAVLVAAAVVLALVATARQDHAPSPPPSAANPAMERTLGGPTSPGSPSPAPGSTGRAGSPVDDALVLQRSVPVSLDVPKIGIHGARLIQLGKVRDGGIQVPPTGPNSPAGWFRDSPTPGQLGPSVVLGHVDSAAGGPAIFFRLGMLRPGDTATITRADRTVAVFRVDSIEEYPKSAFPTLQVFGGTGHSSLRLITCGGTFNPAKKSYEKNIVVYAHLTSSHPA